MSTKQEEHESNTINTVPSSESESVVDESKSHDENQKDTITSSTSSDEQEAPAEQSEAPAEQSEAPAEQSEAPASSKSTSDENEGSEKEEIEAETEESNTDTEVEVKEEEDDDDEADEIDEEEQRKRDEKKAWRKAVEALVDEITEKLEEPNILLTRDVIRYIGIEKAREYFEKTLQIEEEGGVIVTKGYRRRTPGGIFYWLVKEDMTKEEIRRLFPLPKRPVNKAKRNAARKARKIRKQQALLKEMQEAWDTRADVIKDVIKSKNYGKAASIKVTMIGRPSKIIKQKGFVMTTMRGPDRWPSLPKELPNLEASKLVYLVYIGNKQWKRVAKRIKNPEDVLIIEGYLGYEKALKKMVIFAQMVTTKLIQQERREKQRKEAEEKKAAEAKAQAQAKKA